MKPIFAFAALQLISAHATSAVLYSQPSNATGTLHQSSWWDPDGSDYDWYVWDSFIIPASRSISEIQWRGGFLYGGTWSGPVLDFTIAIYPSIAAGTEPDVVHPPLVEYQTGGNANQTPFGVVGTTMLYDYNFVLPTAFQATGGVKYWVHIYAWHHGIPEWGFANASGGNGAHFRRHSEYVFQMAPGDCAFTLIGPALPCPADVTHNGVVDVDDLIMVITHWGATTGAGDTNGDGVVNVDDLITVITAWGACP
jgi:hypothetical protein